MKSLPFFGWATVTLAALMSAPVIASAAPLVRQATGPDASAIQSAVDLFRADIGGANNGASGSFADGRREVNWDGVPDDSSAPNAFPPDFFNVNSARGVVFSTPGEGFQVSANDGTGTPILFGNLNPTYPAEFRIFSPQKLFTAIDSKFTDVFFFLPGTETPATVSAFGAVFTDVDTNTSKIDYYDAKDNLLLSLPVPFQQGANNQQSLAFIGASFANKRIYRVRITSGNIAPSATATDGKRGYDVVTMDDFIYGEPQILK
ncbi:glr3047 [Gloeobacter violaceus PCC 7421]|uniref:Glr3047 protein n=2 Tax=Gloeobacter violaceus TaxID=33072 RepID=Q7NCD2_GLOVI|nr:glr3047 [Gloeobacter violaceus PCC 7421]